MAKYILKDLFDIISSLLYGLHNTCAELQLVYVVEVLMAFCVSHKTYPQSTEFGLITTKEIRQSLTGKHAELWELLVKYRNQFVHDGPVYAEKAFYMVMESAEDIKSLLYYCRIDFDGFNQPSIYISTEPNNFK